jgi:hypothetical protein
MHEPRAYVIELPLALASHRHVGDADDDAVAAAEIGHVVSFLGRAPTGRGRR